jgi:hypothetical protein
MKRFDERRIEDGEAIEYEPDCKKQIQKGGKNNPPTIEDTRKQAIGHLANQSLGPRMAQMKIGLTRFAGTKLPSRDDSLRSSCCSRSFNSLKKAPDF